MGSRVEGGKKAAITNKERYGSDFYKNIGKTGGGAKVPKGFANNHEIASRAGKIGGQRSKRGKKIQDIPKQPDSQDERSEGGDYGNEH